MDVPRHGVRGREATAARAGRGEERGELVWTERHVCLHGRTEPTRRLTFVLPFPFALA